MPKGSLMDAFNSNSLENVYLTRIRDKCTTGVDRINRDAFESRISEHLLTIERKVKNGSYRFTPFKQKLISKGPSKFPRVISIPTIRDKLTLKVAKDILSMHFDDWLSNELIHVTIQRVKNAIAGGGYDSFLKFDIKDFYPSISHKILLSKVRKNLKNRRVVSLISKAVKTPTTPLSDNGESSKKGVPQGLSISNVLAEIYLIDLDKKHGTNERYSYFRYVDDILILCRGDEVEFIKEQLTSDFRDIKLKFNSEKTTSGSINEKFSFLGYQWNGKMFSVRPTSRYKLENSLLKIITENKYSRLGASEFLWKLNLRITGCKYKGHKYGWMFFFSQIDDKRLLNHLDHLVRKWIDSGKSGIDYNSVKKFVRVFHEIRLNLTQTKYIPDFDHQTLEQKREVLQKYFEINSAKLTDERVEELYHQKILGVVRDLERDVQGIS